MILEPENLLSKYTQQGHVQFIKIEYLVSGQC